MDIKSILEFTTPLGMPWHPVVAKGQDFTSSVPYVGLLGDLDKHMVSLSCKKCLKYLDKVLAFQSLTTSKVSHKECMSMHAGDSPTLNLHLQARLLVFPPSISFHIKVS